MLQHNLYSISVFFWQSPHYRVDETATALAELNFFFFFFFKPKVTPTGW